MLNITFLIPLKSPKHIEDYEKFKAILKNSVEYLRRVPNYKLIVISNRADLVSIIQEKEEVVIVPESNYGYGDRDKEYKVYEGCKVWLNHRPTLEHLMILDFDDLVLPEICRTEVSSPNGVYFRAGYQKVFNRLYKYEENFNHHCGSSLIFTKSYIEQMVKSYDSNKSWMFHQSHDLDKMSPIDTPCIIQVPWNGENVYWRKRRFRDIVKYLFSTGFEF